MKLLELQIIFILILHCRQGIPLFIFLFNLSGDVSLISYLIWKVDNAKTSNKIRDSTFRVVASWQANKKFMLKVACFIVLILV